MFQFVFVAGAVSGLLLPAIGMTDAGHGQNADHEPNSISLEIPRMDPHLGREMLAEKCCTAVI